MNRVPSIRLIFLAAALLLSGLVPLANAADFVVVVNAKNTYAGNPSDTKALVTRLYLKQITSWPDGSQSKVFAAPDDSAQMVAFRERILGMSQPELVGHWLSVKQRTGETPPRAMAATAVLIKLIEQYPGSMSLMLRGEAEQARVDGKLKILLEY